MKDVLDYTEDELKSLSTSELKVLLEEASTKERQYWTVQTGLKLAINSLYGAMANKYFPLFNEKMAQAITGNGRFFIRTLGKNIEDALQEMVPNDEPYVLYQDTDSAYFHIEPFVQMFIDKNPESTIDEQVDFADAFEKRVIEPIIARTIKEVTDKLNAYKPEALKADREIIADKAVFIQKKKYIARVRDNEGFRFPEYAPDIKAMGLDLIKSTTPNWSRIKLQESIGHILDKDEESLRNWLRETKSEYLDVPLNDIAQSGGVNNMDYTLGQKGVPIGARAALVHNQYIIDNNLEDRYAPIEPGDKTKRMYLKMPNKFNSNIIAYTNDSFVREIADCVDYDTMFEKGFLSALENMTNALNYDLQRETESLDDW